MSVDCNEWEKRSSNTMYAVIIVLLISIPLLSFAIYETTDTDVVMRVNTDDINVEPEEPVLIYMADEIHWIYAFTNNASFVPYYQTCYLVPENEQFYFKDEQALSEWEAHNFEQDADFENSLDDIEENGYTGVTKLTKNIEIDESEHEYSFEISSDYSIVFGLTIAIIFNASYPTLPITLYTFYYVLHHAHQNSVGDFDGTALFSLDSAKAQTVTFTVDDLYYDYQYIQPFVLSSSSTLRWSTNQTAQAYPFIINGTLSPRL